MRLALQRLGNPLKISSPIQASETLVKRAAASDACAGRKHAPGADCDTADTGDIVDIGDSYSPLDKQVTSVLREHPTASAVRLRGMVSDDASRASFTQGLLDLLQRAPQLRHLEVTAGGWLKVPFYRRGDNHLQGLPHAPKWQWPHAYPQAPEMPAALRGLQALRSVRLSEKAAGAVTYLPPSVQTLRVELGTASELMPRRPVRLPGVRDLEVTTLCERLPEAARIIEGAPRLERLDLRLQNASVGPEDAAFDILWPASLQALRLELREVPAARWHSDLGELRASFLGGLWQSLPPVKALTLDVASSRAPLGALVLEMAGWRGCRGVEQLAIKGVTATAQERQALRNLLPATAEVEIEAVGEALRAPAAASAPALPASARQQELAQCAAGSGWRPKPWPARPAPQG